MTDDTSTTIEPKSSIRTASHFWAETRIVQNHEVRSRVRGPSEANTLLLTPAERDPPFPDLCHIPSLAQLVEVRTETAGVENRVVPHRIVPPTKEDVVPQRRVQDKGGLGDVGDASAY